MQGLLCKPCTTGFAGLRYRSSRFPLAVSQGLNRDSLKTLRHSRFAGFAVVPYQSSGRLRRASHLCRRQGRARKRTVKSESLRKQTLEMPQCGMIQSLTQESSQAGIKLTCGISFLYTWVNHNDQFLQPDCELSEEFKSDCLVWMFFNGKNLTAGADNLLWDNREWSITNHFIPYSLVFRQFRHCTFIVSLQNFMPMKSVCFAVVEYKFIFATFFCFVQSYIGF